MSRRRNTAESFWARTRLMPSGCIEWTGPTHNSGYGQAKFIALTGTGQPIRAHRIAFALAHGHLPAVVHHACENKLCVNPEHLVEFGSHAEHGHLHSGVGCRIHGLKDWRKKPRGSGGHCRICDKERKRRERTSARNGRVQPSLFPAASRYHDQKET